MENKAPKTVALSDLSMALMSAQVRRITKGQTCLMAATTPAPLLIVDCSRRNNTLGAASLASGTTRCNVAPMQRGHLARLIARVSTDHGAREVRATWGAATKALLAEPRHLLNGGAA